MSLSDRRCRPQSLHDHRTYVCPTIPVPTGVFLPSGCECGCEDGPGGLGLSGCSGVSCPGPIAPSEDPYKERTRLVRTGSGVRRPTDTLVVFGDHSIPLPRVAPVGPSPNTSSFDQTVLHHHPTREGASSVDTFVRTPGEWGPGRDPLRVSLYGRRRVPVPGPSLVLRGKITYVVACRRVLFRQSGRQWLRGSNTKRSLARSTLRLDPCVPPPPTTLRVVLGP